MIYTVMFFQCFESCFVRGSPPKLPTPIAPSGISVPVFNSELSQDSKQSHWPDGNRRRREYRFEWFWTVILGVRENLLAHMQMFSNLDLPELSLHLQPVSYI